jgi:hypothetical protein
MTDDPRVMDAQFWTDWLADYVGDAIGRRDSAAQRLITAIGWFWTVYTASSVLGTALAGKSFDGWEAVLALSPIATLSAAYLAALWALNPIAARVAQTESQAIDLWERVLARKLWRLRLASALLTVSTVLIVAGAAVVATKP